MSASAAEAVIPGTATSWSRVAEFGSSIAPDVAGVVAPVVDAAAALPAVSVAAPGFGDGTLVPDCAGAAVAATVSVRAASLAPLEQAAAIRRMVVALAARRATIEV